MKTCAAFIVSRWRNQGGRNGARAGLCGAEGAPGRGPGSSRIGAYRTGGVSPVRRGRADTSIASKGDGTSSETAYQAFDISEEYALCRSLNVSMKSQSIVGPPVNGHPIVDRVVFADSGTKEERVIFFSVDNPTTIKR
jgi:hypothetical protein